MDISTTHWSTKMRIDYNPKINCLEVVCNFAENSLIADLPNRKWQRSRKLWVANVLSQNINFLVTKMVSNTIPASCFTTGALEKIRELSKQFALPCDSLPFPDWYPFKTKPFQHQLTALNQLWGIDRHAIFGEMGTGKTKIAIDLNCARLMADTIDCWVICCPNSIRDNWVDELNVHNPISGITTLVVASLTKAKSQQLIDAAFRSRQLIVIVGMESLSSSYKDGSAYNTLVAIISKRLYSITVDESHYIKNPDANRSRNIEHLAKSARYCEIMTGTPIAQGILDLYQQFQTVNPNIIGIGDHFSFRNRYAQMGGYENRQVIGYKNVDELMTIIKPFVFQCTKQEVLDLPDKLYSKRVVEMTKEQSHVYKEISKGFEVVVADLLGKGASVTVIADQILTQYNALQQITGGFINYDDMGEDDCNQKRTRKTAWLVEPSRNPKVRELMNIVEEHYPRPIIVWAKFRNEIAAIVEALEQGYGPGCVAEYHGGIDNDQRKTNMLNFKSGHCKFFVANQLVGGTGLTINEANVVVYFSNSLKLVERIQSEDRNHRIGQKNDVLYIDLLCKGTKDFDILQAIKAKMDVANWVREQIAR